MSSLKQGLDLKLVVLLGRTLDEYVRFFGLDLEAARGRRILDVASGVSSFTAEARAAGHDVTAFDRIYHFGADEIQARCEGDLDEVARAIGDKIVYRWDYYQNADGMRAFRTRAYQTFLEDFRKSPSCYVAGELPKTNFRDGEFDLTLGSYLLFVYEEQLTYEFQKDSILELARITQGEIRIYPTVTFEAEPSRTLAQMQRDPEFRGFIFEMVPTDFEFLRHSNNYLRITRRG